MAVAQVGPENTIIAIKAKNAVGSGVIVACATSFNLSETRATQSVRCLGQAFDADSPEYGSYSATGSLAGTFRHYSGADVTTNVGYQLLQTWLQTKTVVTMEVRTTVPTGTKQTFDALITGVTLDTPGDSPAAYNISYVVIGVPVTSALV